MSTCPQCRTTYPGGVAVCPTDGSQLTDDPVPLSADSPIAAGDRLGDYLVEEKLGEGGFGTVYRAEHSVIGKTAAVKVLSRRYSSDPEIVSRFIAEARAVNQIRHKNIIDIFAFGTLPDGRHYYVMELLEGMTLDRYLQQQGCLSIEEALPILVGVARALDAAHAAGIAHRDLKPENVFLVFDDGVTEAKLLDFGIAKLLGDPDEERITRTGQPMGTPLYMSPEQCRGTNVDQRTDIYSLGIVTYQMLTGTLPFSGATFMDVMMQQVSEDAPPMSTRAPGLAAALDAPVARMLAKDAAKRPASCIAALEQIAIAAQTAGVDVPIPQRTLTSERRLLVSSRPTVATPAQAALASADTLAQATTGSADTPFSTLPAPRKKRLPLVAAVGVAIAVVLAAFVLVQRPSASPQPLAMTPAASQAAAPAEPSSPAPVVAVSSRIDLTVDCVPKDAEVFLGDQKLGVAPGPFQIDRGNDQIELTLKASGYAPRTVPFTPSANGVVSVTLRKLGHARPGSPHRPGAPADLEF